MLTTTNSTTGTKSAIPDTWPMEGAIVGENVQMRYRDGPLVLKGAWLVTQTHLIVHHP